MFGRYLEFVIHFFLFLWLRLFLLIFPMAGVNLFYVANFANSRQIGVLHLVFSDAISFLICSIFLLRNEIQGIIPPLLVRWQKENWASCSLWQRKPKGRYFFWWNPCFLQIFSVSWQRTLMEVLSIPNIYTKAVVAPIRCLLHNMVVLWQTFHVTVASEFLQTYQWFEK